MNLSHLTAILTVLCSRDVLLVHAINCRSTYEITKACATSYGSVLSITSDVESAAMCSNICSSDARCRSWEYNPMLGMCKTNADHAKGLVLGCGTIYYGTIGKASCRDTWLHVPCTSNSDCVVPNSACFSGTCECGNGWSYNLRDDSCVAACERYGATFKSEDYYLVMHNIDRAYAANLQVCLERCRTWASPTCRSIEYVFSDGLCQLSQETGLTQPGAYTYENNADWVQYLRNCD